MSLKFAHGMLPTRRRPLPFLIVILFLVAIAAGKVFL